jgi:branched-chain amino acid transport system ATP-binding protein
MVPEGRGLFADMSVLDNLRMGTCSRCPSRREQRRRLEEICVLFPVLQERLHGKAGTLSGGQQQMLAVGRALMADPRVLLLDEPSTGLAPLLVADIFRKLRLLKQRGMTIILAEQHVREALRTADRAYVIENGRIVLDGPSAELMDSPDVKKAYLGL